jgi:ribosomal protection tetracycline resistance protein
LSALNLGILAHVDAGKTTLTERLLHSVGIIDELGSVDAGTTQTDTLPLERARGITIRSAVASFELDGVTVNLIDTPGHPDFIAEVERVLSVLDGVVLVVSGVEGVQAQTTVLMRTLRRLHLPTVVFINKLDRRGARPDAVLREIAERLSLTSIRMGTTSTAGERHADFQPYDASDADFRSGLVDVLTTHDDRLLAAYVDDDSGVPYRRLRSALAAQTAQALVHPVYLGSAITGTGVDALLSGIAELLPASDGDIDAPASGRVFKIERGPAGEKIAYVRMFAGAVRTRDRLPYGADLDGKVTAVRAITAAEDDSHGRRPQQVEAGQIGRLWGLHDVRIGDDIGERRRPADEHHGGGSGIGGEGQFAPPTLETVVSACDPTDGARLHTALTQLAEQDPLINLRQDGVRHETSVSLYGEVQKEVIQATLADVYGIDVTFRESTTICVERPVATGEAVEVLNADDNPFRATIRLRVEPAPDGSGVEFRLPVETRDIPLYLYRSRGHFAAMMERYVRQALREGLRGWQVTDCVVSMVECVYASPDGPPSTRGPLSAVADFRDLTPLVAVQALADAGTTVCEPMHRFQIELPAESLGAVLPALTSLRATPEAPTMRGSSCLLEGEIPAAQVHRLHKELPALTSGEGMLDTSFSRYQAIRGPAPSRQRLTTDPLDRKAYLRQVQGRPN